MEICFADKELLNVVAGTYLPPPPDATVVDRNSWTKKNVLTRQIISSSVSLAVLEDLVNCTSVVSLWSTLCSFYQQKSQENIYLVQASFFECKMSRGDSINTHVNKVMSLGNLLKYLGKSPEDMLISKKISSLLPSYNSIIPAWTNLAEEERTVKNLTTRLRQMKNIMMLQTGGNDLSVDKAFFTRTCRYTDSKSSQSHSKDRKKDQTRERDKDHLRQLKENSMCWNCGKP